MTGFLNSATTSRMISIDSASSRRRCRGKVRASGLVIFCAFILKMRSVLKMRSFRRSRGRAPGDEIAVSIVGLAVAHGAAVEVGDGAAGGQQHGMARGGVPFHGRRQPRIDVGTAFGDHAELEGGAGGRKIRDPVPLHPLS